MWVDKYAKNQGSNSEQAMKSLHSIRTKHWQMTLKQFEAKAKQGGYETELNNEYYRSRIARLSSLEEQMRQLTRGIARKHTETMRNALGSQYNDTYMRSTFNIQAQKCAFISDFAHFNETQLKLIASDPWGKDGKDFSKRIWKNYQQELPSCLMGSLFRATVMGWGPQKVGQMMHARFQDVQRNKVHNLVTSEMGHIAEEATAKSYEESDIDEYEYMATLESHTCTTCGHLDGQHFKMTERKVGVNYPLIHARCRCTTVPYIEGMPEYSERWMRDPETGKGKLIKNVKFDEWKKQYSGDYLKSSPWVKEPKMDSLSNVPANLRFATINAANETIENVPFLKRKFRDSKLQIDFDAMAFFTNPKAVGATSKIARGSIVLNPAIYNSEKQLAVFLKDNHDWFVKVKPSKLRTYPVVHELGHVLHNEMWTDFQEKNPDVTISREDFINGELEKIYKIYQSMYDTGAGRNKLPSMYARQRSSEAFAELFTLSQIGFSDNKWIAVMKKYLKGVK